MNKLEAKVILMNELLDSARETYLNRPTDSEGNRKPEKLVKGDVYDVSSFSSSIILRDRLSGRTDYLTNPLL